MTDTPQGFTRKGAAPGFLLRKPTSTDKTLKRLRDENAELKQQLAALAGRMTKLEGTDEPEPGTD